MNENVHLSWHRLRKGMCLTCGYHCIDCPKGVASCKCTPKAPHTFDEDCRNKYCKIHWIYLFELGYMRYPEGFNILTSEQGWVHQIVHCGPTVYLPKKMTFPTENEE